MRKRRNILVLHGPNLDLLGEREPALYGRESLSEVNASIMAEARRLGLRCRIFQRNGEGELLDVLHRLRRWAHGVLINPGAYAHYSYALRDGLAAVSLPAVEVHLTDTRKREPWRRVSVTAEVCCGRIVGKGPAGYLRGLRLLARKLDR
ncbi:MAG: 3-dehydroquinate dehydratase [Elusimicrobia bacterium]|nr:3-dehydroquinate dehydratase [Elusimicrobiota bacterium]